MAVVQYTFTQKQYIEQHNSGRVRTVPRLCEVYPDICLTTEDKARKNLSQGNRRIPVGKEYTEQSILVTTFFGYVGTAAYQKMAA